MEHTSIYDKPNLDKIEVNKHDSQKP